MNKVIIGRYDLTSLYEVIDSVNCSDLAKALDEAIFQLVYNRLRDGNSIEDESRISNLRYLRDGLEGIKLIKLSKEA